MTVRAKFKVESIGRQRSSVFKDGVYVDGEMQTVRLSPVYANGDPTHENSKFWQATPSGEVTLGMVNADAGAFFDLGAEYYLDFTKA